MIPSGLSCDGTLVAFSGSHGPPCATVLLCPCVSQGWDMVEPIVACTRQTRPGGKVLSVFFTNQLTRDYIGGG